MKTFIAGPPVEEPDLGQIAYEAYCKERGWLSHAGQPLPPWDEQSQGLRDAWTAAAEAVREAVEPSIEESIDFDRALGVDEEEE
jgi:hypothetical protein